MVPLKMVIDEIANTGEETAKELLEMQRKSTKELIEMQRKSAEELVKCIENQLRNW